MISIDELHCITDGEKNINNPNPNTATAFWQLIDQCAENPNIIVTGIMNDGSKMPEPLKSRFRTDTYIIKAKDELKERQVVLNFYLSKKPNTCDNNCEKKITKLLKSSEARIIEGIVNKAEQISSIGKNEWKITQQDLETAIKRYEESDPAFENKEEDQYTKTLKAQERAANASTVASYTNVAVVGGGLAVAAAYETNKVVNENGGWKKAFEKTAAITLYLGKVGGQIYIGGRVPSFQEFAKEIAFDQVKNNDAKGHSDYEQK